MKEQVQPPTRQTRGNTKDAASKSTFTTLTAESFATRAIFYVIMCFVNHLQGKANELILLIHPTSIHDSIDDESL